MSHEEKGFACGCVRHVGKAALGRWVTACVVHQAAAAHANATVTFPVEKTTAR